MGVASDSRGRIVAAGYTGDFPDWDFALARYRRNGSLDGSFGAHGKVTTDLGMTDSASSVAIDSHDRIVVAGRTDFLPPCCGGTEAGDFALVRYNPNGLLDPTFDGDGKVTTPIGMSEDIATAVAIQPDERIVAAGYSSDGSSPDFALVRYNENGSLDPTFDTPIFLPRAAPMSRCSTARAAPWTRGFRPRGSTARRSCRSRRLTRRSSWHRSWKRKRAAPSTVR